MYPFWLSSSAERQFSVFLRENSWNFKIFLLLKRATKRADPRITARKVEKEVLAGGWVIGGESNVALFRGTQLLLSGVLIEMKGLAHV